MLLGSKKLLPVRQQFLSKENPNRNTIRNLTCDFRFRQKYAADQAYLTYSAEGADFTVTDSRGLAPHSAFEISNYI